MEIILTESARAKFNSLDNKITRIYIKSATWSGIILGVTPGEKNEDDELIISEGFNFVIEKGLMKHLGSSLKIDYKESGLSRGFRVYL